MFFQSAKGNIICYVCLPAWNLKLKVQGDKIADHRLETNNKREVSIKKKRQRKREIVTFRHAGHKSNASHTFLNVVSFHFSHPFNSHVKVIEFEDFRPLSGISGYFKVWSKDQLLFPDISYLRDRVTKNASMLCRGMDFCPGRPGWRTGNLG